MSVVIKDMELPNSCDECPFARTNDDLEIDDFRYRYCDFPYIGEYITDYISCRYEGCPLSENEEY